MGSTTVSFDRGPLTGEGTIVGTFQYMAPEQLQGKEADERTDVFAFGTLLFEMATGHKAFDARTQTGLIASILSEQPPAVSKARAARDCLQRSTTSSNGVSPRTPTTAGRLHETSSASSNGSRARGLR